MIDEFNRFTDFLVYEIDLDGNTLHLKTLENPVSLKKENESQADSSGTSKAEGDVMDGIEDSASIKTEKILEVEDTPNLHATTMTQEGKSQVEEPTPQPSRTEPWPEHFTTTLASFLSEEVIGQVKHMFLEGPEPPRVSDNGWGTRVAKPSAEDDILVPTLEEQDKTDIRKRGKDRGGRGSRGGRGGKGGRGAGSREDHRKVLSDVRDLPHLNRLNPNSMLIF